MHSVVYDYQAFSLQQYGGVSRYFCELALRVHRAEGFCARVIAPVHFNSHLADCPVPQTACHLRKHWRTGPIYRAANRWLSPALTRLHSPSLIHRSFFEPLGTPAGVPVVVTVFDMINELFPGSFPASDHTARNKRLCVERADHVLCISERTADDLVRLCGVSRTKISVTYLGHSDVFTAPPPTGETAPHPRPYLLYVGHRAGHKNFDLALQAYANSERLRRQFDLVAFGGLPFSADEKSRVAELKLDMDRVVRWTGSDADLARAYRHARAFVYPSRYEGFGIPPLEAMSSGCAVACSNASSIPEVVGDAAALFDPTDIDSIRQAIETACFDDGRRAQLMAAGKTRAQHFSWDRCAADTLAAYAVALGTSSGSADLTR